MYTVLSTLSEYIYFYTSKHITSYTYLLIFKIVESLQCILKYFGAVILKNYCHICNQPSPICQNAMFHVKIKILKSGTENIFLG